MLLLLIATLALASCGGNVEIAIKEDAMPQSVFVRGEELDLSSGILVVDQDGEKLEVPMNDEGVTVSGYDKNTLGEQTLTITYKDKSVELTVTVVERMQVTDYTANYLVDDVLDLSAGRFKITRNDGSNYTVTFKDSKLSFSGFDSSSVGKKTVTATYTSGSDVYTASFDVNIYAVEKVELTSPTKVSYNSHDSGVDVAGGVLTLSALNGSIKREVPVTADMIKGGFDLSAANETNSPLPQNVEVHYNNEIYTYEIRIIYTSVSKFKDNADLVASLEWSGAEEPEISAEIGDKALELMELYFDMSPAEKSLLTREETLNMARAAMIYGFTQWYNDLAEFDGAFGIDEYGDFEIICKDEAAVSAAITKLQKTDRPIYELYNVLNSMAETFAEEVLFSFTGEDGGDAMFASYTTIDPEVYPELINIFEYMLELDALMDKVGDDWLENTAKYAANIEAVYDSIVNGDFYSYDYAQFFYYVSMWRANDDAFDFLYYYYYDVKVFDANDADNDSQQRVSAILSIANIRLPSELEVIFAHVSEAMNQLDYLAQYMTADTTQFFYHYFKACSLSEELLDAEGAEADMLKVLYFGLPINSMLGLDGSEIYTFGDIISHLMNAEGGYYALCGALLELPEFDALMDKYFDIIINIFETDDYENSAAYISDVKAMLALYFELAPAQQFSFLGTLNAFYAMNIPPLAFDNTGEYASFVAIFTNMVNEVYMGLFETQSGKDAYFAFILATETYAQRFTSETWLDSFKTYMTTVADALAGTAMSAKDKATFNTELGALYTEYLALLGNYTETTPENPGTTPDLGEWADEFEALKNAAANLEASYAILEYGRYVYDVFFSSFERTQKIYNDILTNAPDDIKYILVHEGLYGREVVDSNGQATGEMLYWSYDYVLSVYRSIYVNALLNLGAYELYKEYNMAELMDKVYDVYWVNDMSKTLATMEYFAKLDVETQIIFILYFSTDEEFNYYSAIAGALEDAKYSENVQDAVSKLLNVEMTAMIYNFYISLFEDSEITADDEATIKAALEDFKAAYAELEAAYSAVTDPTDLAQLADFKTIYEFYVALAASLFGTAA